MSIWNELLSFFIKTATEYNDENYFVNNVFTGPLCSIGPRTVKKQQVISDTVFYNSWPIIFNKVAQQVILQPDFGSLLQLTERGCNRKIGYLNLNTSLSIWHSCRRPVVSSVNSLVLTNCFFLFQIVPNITIMFATCTTLSSFSQYRFHCNWLPKSLHFGVKNY